MIDDTIPCTEIYRGVEVHNAQTPERIERIVKPEIDRVMEHPCKAEWLAAWADNWLNCPESRLLAAAMVKAIFASRVDGRRERSQIDLDRVNASVAGLGNGHRRDKKYYCSALDCWRARPGAPLPPARPGLP